MLIFLSHWPCLYSLSICFYTICKTRPPSRSQLILYIKYKVNILRLERERDIFHTIPTYINDSTTGIKFVYEQLNAHSENIKVCLPFNLVSSRFIINAYEPRQSVQKRSRKSRHSQHRHSSYHLTLWRGESLVVSAVRSRRLQEYWVEALCVHCVCRQPDETKLSVSSIHINIVVNS